MPTQLEQELLAMMNQHRLTIAAETANTLPEIIIPEALLSATAQAEIRGAREMTLQMRPFQTIVAEDAFTSAPERVAATIESILLDQALRETGMAIDHNISAADAFPIEYENDDLVGTTVPNERVRFQVGRHTPPAENFRYQSTTADTTVVAERGPNGRFQTIPVDRSANGRPRVVSPVRAPVQPNPTQEPLVRKSSYERLLGPSIFDD